MCFESLPPGFDHTDPLGLILAGRSATSSLALVYTYTRAANRTTRTPRHFSSFLYLVVKFATISSVVCDSPSQPRRKEERWWFYSRRTDATCIVQLLAAKRHLCFLLYTVATYFCHRSTRAQKPAPLYGRAEFAFILMGCSDAAPSKRDVRGRVAS